MKKYKAKSIEIIQAKQYVYGMEDGVYAYELNGSYLGRFEKGKGYPKTKLIPFVTIDEQVGRETFEWGDYFVKYLDGAERWISKDSFEHLYEEAE